jgi:hypothetical protein
MLLLATYPGIYYWAGLPYSYAAIVPATLAATMIVRELETTQRLDRIALLSMALGTLFLAYDLMAYFAPAAVLVLTGRKKFRAVAAAVPLILLPTLVNNWILVRLVHVNFPNENAYIYTQILAAYRNPPEIGTWLRHISPAPRWLVRAFFFSNFTFLPAAFLAAAVANRFTRSRTRLGPSGRWILLVALALFLFVNIAPPNGARWQFRGDGMSRIYQPVFAAMVLFIAGVAQANGRWVSGPVAIAAAINASIVLGPLTLNPLAGWAYLKFYAHAPSPQMYRNLTTFGRRPLGVCDTSITIDNPPPQRKGPKKPPAVSRKKKHAASAPVLSPLPPGEG